MVHALREIRRVLVKDGIMIDMRPVLDQWPIEVVSARGIQETGHFQDVPSGMADDEAANRSIRASRARGMVHTPGGRFLPLYLFMGYTQRDGRMD